MNVNSHTTDNLIEMITTSKKTVDFYNKHTNIDFVKMNDILVDLLEDVIINIKEITTTNIINMEIQKAMEKEIHTNLTTRLNKFHNLSLKEHIAENNVEELLCSMYKSSEIISNSGDMILKRVNMEPILFKVKDSKYRQISYILCIMI